MDNLDFKKLRIDKGYTQVQIAPLLGVNPEQVSRLENGHCEIRKTMWIIIKGLPKNK